MNKELIEISEVAMRMGVTIRALHYYDQIGLLVPKEYTEAKYRLYSHEELERLEQILFLKEIGFELKQIKRLLDAPNYDKKEIYKRQRALIFEKRKQLDQMLHRLDTLIEEKETSSPGLSDGKKTVGSEPRGGKKKSKGLSDANREGQAKALDYQKIVSLQKKYYQEILNLYGHTGSFKQFEAKSLVQGKEKLWKNLNEKANELFRQIAVEREKGEKAGSPYVQRLIKEWQDYISQTQYECTIEILEGLGKLYVSDQRFYDYFERIQSGLAEFISEAIEIYVEAADKHKE